MSAPSSTSSTRRCASERARCGPTSTCTWRRASSSPCSARTARARPACCARSSGCSRSPPAGSASPARTCGAAAARSATSRSSAASTRSPRCGRATSSGSASTGIAGASVRSAQRGGRAARNSTRRSPRWTRCAYADRPVGQLSGGEQQRVRIAQALATDPTLLLCDEPLLSLDLQHQQAVTALVDRRRRTHDTAVVFVTHEINPVLPYVDRVLYLAGGRFRVGTVDEVMTSRHAVRAVRRPGRGHPHRQPDPRRRRRRTSTCTSTTTSRAAVEP